MIADVTEPHVRAVAFSLLLICGSSTIWLPPQIAIVVGNVNATRIAVIVSFLGLIYGLKYLPETLSPENKERAIQRRKVELENGVTLLSRICQPFRDLKILNRNVLFRLITFVVILSITVKAGERVLFLFYMEGQLGFTGSNVATYTLIHSYGGVLAQSFILNAMVQRIGERNVVIIAMICGAFSSFLYGIAKSPTLIYIGALIFAVSGIDNATISSILSFNVPEYELGKIQGVYGAITAIATGLGPLFLNYIYILTADGAFLGPGTFFFVSSLFYSIAAILAYVLPKESANSKRYRNEIMGRLLLSEDNV